VRVRLALGAETLREVKAERETMPQGVLIGLRLFRVHLATHCDCSLQICPTLQFQSFSHPFGV
jgi:hypothetical protein